MSDRRNDLDRARELGMSIDEFQALAGFDPLETYGEFLRAGVVGPKDTREADDADDVKLKDQQKKKKKEKKEVAGDADATYGDMLEVNPFEPDSDVNNKNSRNDEMEHYWTRPVTSPEDKALYYGFHTHGKDNMYGLHAHYPGGPLGGGHLHGPQNLLGYHTHRYNNEELLQFKFARPGIMIQLDGPHQHQENAPDGKHRHSEENFGPASDLRAQDVAERNSQTDTN